MSQRTRSVKSGKVGSSAVDSAVKNLLKMKNQNQLTSALLSLRQQYGDEDLVNKIQEEFMMRHSSIVRAAKKFAIAVKAKYANQNVPFHYLLMKARAHAKKHHLSDDEFAEFQRIYEQELSGSSTGEVVIPVTNLMKVLGNVNTGADNYFNVNDDDARNLQEILKLHETSKPLHAQALLQSIQYQGYSQSLETQAAEFNKNFMNPVDYIHPVIAALFLPKYSTVDSHFLLSNMAGIVKSRYNRSPITTKADYELFYNLVTDPNDVVCDTRTPVGDLLHRCNLQAQLWNSVLHLRNGQVFTPSAREFTAAVDVCRLNKHDNPDFVYGRHDGTVLKRLFSAFSFRPTTVATMPVANVFAFNPYSQVIRPTVTNIPMINIRALATQQMTPNNKLVNGVQDLVIQNTQSFIEGNVITSRLTKIMYSREILVVYIDRRVIQYSVANTPFNLLRLPTSAAGMEKVTTEKICEDVESSIDIDGDTYVLTSAIVLDTDNLTNIDQDANTKIKYVKGSYAVIRGGETSDLIMGPLYRTGTMDVPPNMPPLIDNKYQVGGLRTGLWQQYKPYATNGNKLTSVYDDMKEDFVLKQLNTNGNVLIYHCPKNAAVVNQLVF
jgi:hypothetical protein